MLEITKLLANKPITVEAKSETTEHRQVNYSGTNFQSDISGGQVNQAETVTAHYTEPLLSALQDGMEEAIAHNLNHPAAPFFLEAIKDWPSNDS